MRSAKLVLAIAVVAGFSLSSISSAQAQWGGGCHPQAYRAYSAGYGPGWNSYSGVYRTGYYGVPGYYRSAGFYPGPGIYSVQRAVVPVPAYRPVVVGPAWGPGWGGGFGPGWGTGFGPGWGGSGVALRVGF